MDKNKVKLTVGGVNYIVITDNEPQYAEFLASEIDARLGEITARSRFITDAQATVLLSLEYADSYHKAKKECEDLKERLKESLEDAAKAKTQRDALKRENLKLKKSKKSPEEQEKTEQHADS